MRKMSQICKHVMFNRNREDIIRWYEALEIPYSRKYSTKYLVENLYRTLHGNEELLIHIKPEHERLSKEDLKFFKEFFGVILEYKHGPMYRAVQ